MSHAQASTRDAALEHARVALLTNFIPPYRVPLFQALAKRLGRLRIFVATEMEANRDWPVAWGDLDVEVLRSLTFRETSRHPHAFEDPTEVHLPLDAFPRLWSARPDLIVSGQLGAASLLAALYCALRRNTRFVLWLTLSEVSEMARGRFRRALRTRLLARADAILVNGESGARYATALGAARSRIFRVHQAIDATAFAAPAIRRAEGGALRLLFVGSAEPRKGLKPFLARLAAWSAANPDRPLRLQVAGCDRESVAAVPDLPATLDVEWLGRVPYESLPERYADADLLVFPTLADEWGLVVNEAMTAGLPVLGSVHSQAVVELIEDGRSGWHFQPDDDDRCREALDRALHASAEQRTAIALAGRERIRAFGIEAVAERMLAAIAFALGDQSSDARDSSPAYSE